MNIKSLTYNDLMAISSFTGQIKKIKKGKRALTEYEMKILTHGNDNQRNKIKEKINNKLLKDKMK